MRRILALGPLFALLGAPALARADEALPRIAARDLELVRPSVESIFGAAEAPALEAAIALERTRLEAAAREQPDARIEATLVFAQPVTASTLLELCGAPGAEVLSLRSRTKSSDGIQVKDYDLAALEGDLAAKLETIDDRPRSGLRTKLGAGLETPGRSPTLGRDEVRIERQERRPEPKRRLRFVEARLVTTPARLLQQLEGSAVLAAKLDDSSEE